ncbi:MAG TPA: hypothetical protein VIW70_12950 [Rubrivivax sp.]
MLASVRFALVLLGAQAAFCTGAAPYRPPSDQQVVETLPARAADPRMREMRESRAALARNPRDLDLALRLARLYYAEVAAEGDPRYIGYAQAALAPWWDEPAPPAEARVMRAILRQFNHGFDAANADLDAALQADPANGQAWAWRAAIAMVQADYAQARRACLGLQPRASNLIGSACRAQVDGTTGQAPAAALALRSALARSSHAPAAERLWALTRLAEIEERLGEHAAAEASYRLALELGLVDGYLLAAYSDFLLDRDRPREVLALLKDKGRSDLLLLRLALAAKALGDPALKVWESELAARFDAARLRGDSVHEKEEARFALAVQGQPARALVLAQQNFAVQREPADARVLLEAALGAGQPAAAAPALKWMADAGIESAVLRGLERKLKGPP